MREALEEAKRKLEECKEWPDCWGEDQYSRVIKNLESARYIYRPDMDACGMAERFWGARTISISSFAFDWGSCCDLASTLAHEANHLGRLGKDGGEAASRQIEKRCFNCPCAER